MIDHELKYIFIHIPKTGGSSIELNLVRLHHPEVCGNLAHWNDNIKEKFHVGVGMNHHWPLSKILTPAISEYKSFCFVRNPYDRIVSEYLYVKRGYNLTGSVIPDLKFSTFIRQRLINKISQPYHDMSQSDYIDCASKSIDYIGRFEELQTDFNRICRDIKIPTSRLPSVNKSNHKKHYSSYYDTETKRIVTEMYSDDLKRFGYEFD